MFRKHVILGTFAALAASVALGMGTVNAEGHNKRASIAFADLGGIKDWRSDSSDELYVESIHNKWYKATFFGPCFDLPFADRIAFVTEPDGSLDKFSSILVDGHRCHFRTFEAVDGPGGGADKPVGEFDDDA